MDSSAFEPAKDFCAKVFAGGQDPQEDSVENFVSAVYQLFDGSEDEEIKECSDDTELSAFPKYVLEETGTQKELLKVWQTWYKGIQVRKGGLVQLGVQLPRKRWVLVVTSVRPLRRNGMCNMLQMDPT